MANSVMQLSDIRQQIKDSKGLILDENVLGQALSSLIKGLLKQSVDFRLINCVLKEPYAEHHITFSGEFLSLYGWKNVRTEFCLFECSIPGSTIAERHSVFTIEIPDNVNLHDYLVTFFGSLNEDLRESAAAALLNLVDYYNNIEFGNKLMLFSSLDYSRGIDTSVFYPDKHKDIFLSNQVRQGINFHVQVSYDEDIADFFADVFKGSDSFRHLLVSGSSGIGLVSTVHNSVNLTVAKPVDIALAIDPFKLSFKELSLLLPLLPEDRAEPGISLNGEVTIAQTSLKVSAEFYPQYRDFYISFFDFPTLSEIISLVEKKGQDNYFPDPFSSMLSIKLSKLTMGFSLVDKSVSQIGFSLKSEKDIPLIENIISFKPRLEMQIYSPFDDEYRSIQGELHGIWTLGKTEFDTVLYYPSFSFSAGMAKGQSLDVDKVFEKILFGIVLPKPDIKLTQMEVRGNFRDKSFTAEITVEDHWEFPLAGRRFGLQITHLMLAYENKQVGGSIDGVLKLADVDVIISAEYADSNQGWMLAGRTNTGTKINLTAIANDLLESLALPVSHATDGSNKPESLSNLELTNIIFSAIPKSEEYSICGQTAKDWKMLDGLSLTVYEFAAEKTKGLSITGRLWVSLTIADIVVRLKAEKLQRRIAVGNLRVVAAKGRS